VGGKNGAHGEVLGVGNGKCALEWQWLGSKLVYREAVSIGRVNDSTSHYYV